MKDSFVEIWYGDILSNADQTNESSSDNTIEQIYWSLLSKDERKKAEKYKRWELKQKYIKTRGVLRTILASYLNLKPQNLVIKTTEYGKPFLFEQNLFFNLSHTRNRFVLAVCNMSAIGIDLEYVRERANLSGLVKKCFADSEMIYWNSLSTEQKTIGFYRFWVRKEAFVKAVGRGISLGLDQCVINPEEQSQFLSIPESYGLASEWKITDIVLEQGDICVLVTKDQPFNYQLIRYSE